MKEHLIHLRNDLYGILMRVEGMQQTDLANTKVVNLYSEKRENYGKIKSHIEQAVDAIMENVNQEEKPIPEYRKPVYTSEMVYCVLVSKGLGNCKIHNYPVTDTEIKDLKGEIHIKDYEQFMRIHEIVRNEKQKKRTVYVK